MLVLTIARSDGPKSRRRAPRWVYPPIGTHRHAHMKGTKSRPTMMGVMSSIRDQSTLPSGKRATARGKLMIVM